MIHPRDRTARPVRGNPIGLRPGTCLVAAIVLGMLSACQAAAWPSGSTDPQGTWQGWQVRKVTDHYFLSGPHATAGTLLSSIRETSAAFERMVGQSPPPGLVLVIDTEEQSPLPGAYEWFSAAAQAKAVALRNPLPCDESIRKQWLAETVNTPLQLAMQGAGPQTQGADTDFDQLIQSQEYWAVKAPFSMLAPTLAGLLELPPDLKDDIEWGLLAASDGLSTSVADDLVALGLDAHNASTSMRMASHLFRGRARRAVLKDAQIRMQVELFATWLCLTNIESTTIHGFIRAYIHELAPY